MIKYNMNKVTTLNRTFVTELSSSCTVNYQHVPYFFSIDIEMHSTVNEANFDTCLPMRDYVVYIKLGD